MLEYPEQSAEPLPGNAMDDLGIPAGGTVFHDVGILGFPPPLGEGKQFVLPAIERTDTRTGH